MKLSKKAIAGIIAAVVLIVMFVTVPKKDAHMTAISEKWTKQMIDDCKDEQEKSLCMALGGNMVNKVLTSKLEVSNYGLCSVGRIKGDKKTKTVSFGILGMVFVSSMDKEQLEKSVK